MNLLECPALLSFLRRYSLAHAYYYPGMTVVLAQFIPLCMSKLYIFFFFSWPQGKAPLRYLLLCLFLLSFLNVCGGACSSCGYKASFWLFIKKISIVFNCLNFSMCCVLSLVAQLCPTLCDLMDCSLPGSSVHGDSPGKILEWVAMPSPRGSSQSRDWIQFSHTTVRFCISWVTREAHEYWSR